MQIIGIVLWTRCNPWRPSLAWETSSWLMIRYQTPQPCEILKRFLIGRRVRLFDRLDLSTALTAVFASKFTTIIVRGWEPVLGTGTCATSSASSSIRACMHFSQASRAFSTSISSRWESMISYQTAERKMKVRKSSLATSCTRYKSAMGSALSTALPSS